MSRMSPCKNCSDRTVEPNCHDECAKYAQWKAEDHKAKAAEAEWRNKRREEYLSIERKNGYRKHKIGGEQ